MHSLRAPPGRCLFNRGNHNGPMPGWRSPQVSRSTPARSRDTRGVSSLEHESVYKFMIMTTLLSPHISIIYRILLPSRRRRRRRRGLPACALDVYTGVLRSLPSPFRRIVSDGTTTRFCIYIQPFVTVRKAVTTRVPRSVLPNRQNPRGEL